MSSSIFTHYQGEDVLKHIYKFDYSSIGFVTYYNFYIFDYFERSNNRSYLEYQDYDKARFG